MKIAFAYMNNECNVGRGAGYVAGAVIRSGHALSFFDTLFTPTAAVADRVIEGRYDALMISTMTMLFPEALQLAKRVKAKSGLPVLLGGIHPTIAGPRLLDEHAEFDYLCIGEGESFVTDFLANLSKPGLLEVPNLAFRRDGRAEANPSRGPEDLARLPPFPWYLFPKQAVVQEGQQFLYVNATRGCPFACTYCCNTAYLRLYGKHYVRFRPVEHVIDELRLLQRTYAPGLFYFGDEMILSSPDYAQDLFQAIHRELGVPYGCMARVECMTPEMVSLMAETGCQYVGMGVECGDEAFRRKQLGRTMTNKQIESAFELVRRAGIFCTSFNMIGYPSPDDPRLTESTAALTEKLRPNYAQFSIFYPFPGTKIHQQCVEKDLIDQEKLHAAKDYFDESVLKGVSLKDKKNELNARFNPEGFRLQIRPLRRAAAGAAAGYRGGPRVLMFATDHLLLDRRILQQARSLTRAGCDVTVVSGFECPNEEHYMEQGVAVHRYKYLGGGDGYPNSWLGLMKRLVRRGLRFFGRPIYGSHPFESFIRQKVSQFPADVVHVHDLPLLWLGVELADKWNAKLVYDAHEIYYVHHSIPPRVRKLQMRQERNFVPRTDLFSTVNEKIADYFQEQYGVRPLVLMNCVETPPEGFDRDSRQLLRQRAGLPSETRVVLYQGWFSPERNLLSLVRAAEFLPPDCALVMIGYGDHERDLRDALRGTPGESRVRFLGQVPPEQLMALTAGADLGVIPYQPVDLNHDLCSPNKFFEFVQAGVPVVAHDLVFFRDMGRRYGVVSVGDLSTASGTAAAIRSVLDDRSRWQQMQNACRKTAETLNWETEARRLVDAYPGLLPPPAERELEDREAELQSVL